MFYITIVKQKREYTFGLDIAFKTTVIYILKSVDLFVQLARLHVQLHFKELCGASIIMHIILYIHICECVHELLGISHICQLIICSW